jgi:hypothetical protein
MDLTQNKLTRAEWDSIEVPVSESENEILKMIIEGFTNRDIVKNKTMSLFSFTKIEKSIESEKFLYNKYFDPIVQEIIKKYGSAIAIAIKLDTATTKVGGGSIKKMKSIDLLRIQNLESNIENNKKIVYEFIALELCHNLCKYLSKNKSKYALYLYTLIQLSKSSIYNINKHVTDFISKVVSLANTKTDLSYIIKESYIFIEQNKCLLEYEDAMLFSHQKQLFSIFNQEKENPRLVLYIAPTGTGKTLSPIGLSTKYRIIFVCVARHIGLALAKSAISMEKKIAFAFGCETASDIRLHYFSAVDYTRDRKSGGIRKVDNSNGSKVEIMICDVKSYITAMNYMLAFNSETQVITYWDEPTITMDYEEHELHSIIHRNWVENKIPNVVLSCATLPKEDEILETLADFRVKFDNAEIHSITSYDCKKSIPILTKDGFCALPHTMYSNHTELLECVRHCESNKTLLRYFDLNEIVKFAFYVNSNNLVNEQLMMKNYFREIVDITMNSLKLYYLELLKHIEMEKWESIYTYMKSIQKMKFEPVLTKTVSIDSSPFSSTNKSGGLNKNGGLITRTQSVYNTNTNTNNNNNFKGLLLTTSDAHTLTDGPTIFLTEDAKKIGNFYTQQSAIPEAMFQDILNKIDSNNKISSELFEFERELDLLEKPDEEKKTKMKEKSDENKSAVVKDLYKKIEALRKKIRYIALDAEYIPNTIPHQNKWTGGVNEKSFCPNISEDSVKEIMGLEIDNYLKILMLLGIGLFIQDIEPRYLELMKKLAQNQELYIIVASSDFIFGTNYNFCHGFIGKDMINMTQAKTIQCLGRIGRSAIQSTYTVRFRDDEFIYNLFKTPVENREALNMSKLFSSD